MTPQSTPSIFLSTSSSLTARTSPFRKRCAAYADNTKNARPIKDEWQSFLSLWHSLTQDQNKPVILSDNPAFDIGVIDKQLTALGLGTGLSIRYSPSGKYIKVHDPSAATFLLSPKAKEDVIASVNSIAPHTHRAIDDALHILHLHMLLESVKSSEVA